MGPTSNSRTEFATGWGSGEMSRSTAGTRDAVGLNI